MDFDYAFLLRRAISMFVSSLVYSRRSSSMINIRFSGVASVLRSSAVSWSTTYKFHDYMERD